jgi:hypothetical protein
MHGVEGIDCRMMIGDFGILISGHSEIINQSEWIRHW